jgi:hypothetical protein
MVSLEMIEAFLDAVITDVFVAVGLCDTPICL